MAIQRNLDKPGKRADRSITKFKRGKPEVLFLERNTARQAPELHWGPPSWAGKQIVRKGFGGPEGHQAQHKPKYAPFWQGRAMVS